MGELMSIRNVKKCLARAFKELPGENDDECLEAMKQAEGELIGLARHFERRGMIITAEQLRAVLALARVGLAVPFLLNSIDALLTQRPIAGGSSESKTALVTHEPFVNEGGALCCLCDGTYRHEHPQLRCLICGATGLHENMEGLHICPPEEP